MSVTRIIEVMSGNSGPRGGYHPQACVFHYTRGGRAKYTAEDFATPGAGRSAHWVISRRGEWYRCVDHSRAAWHAGVSEIVIDGSSYPNVNQRTVGIELANKGLLTPGKDGAWFWWLGGKERGRWIRYKGAEPQEGVLEYDDGQRVHGYWEPYPDAQIDSLQALLRHIAKEHPQAAQNLIGHEDVAMPLGRKKDPGALFPWERFRSRLTRRVVSRPRMIA